MTSFQYRPFGNKLKIYMALHISDLASHIRLSDVEFSVESIMCAYKQLNDIKFDSRNLQPIIS